MADIKPTAQTLLNNITNDVKNRSLLDTSESGDLAGQFSEVMMSRLSNLGINDQDMKAYLKKISQKAALDQQSAVDRSANVKAPKELKEKQPVDKTSIIDEKAAIKEKLQAYIKELAAKDDLPVEDTKAMKALQKVAAFLVKAANEGTIDLPPELTQKLQQFLAKGDEFNAYDMSVFMQDFISAFRDIKINMAAPLNADKSVEGLQWPKEIVQAFEDLGIKSLGGGDKALTIVDILRSVKALVNESKLSADSTLDKKSKEAELPQDQLAALPVNNAAATAVVVAPTPALAAETVITTPVAEVKPPEVATLVQAVVMAKQNEIETSLSVDNNKIAETVAQNNAATTLPNPFDKSAKDADKNKAASPVWAGALPSSFVTLNETKEATKDQQPSLTNLAMNAAFPGRAADDKKSLVDGKPSGYSDQVKQSNFNAAVAAPVAADVSSKIVDKGLDQISTNTIAVGGVDNASAANVKNAVRAAATAATGPQLPSAATQQVMAQISQKANKTTNISVQLTPAELGRVEVRLTIQRDGSVHAVVIADKPETLALLQKDASQLERSLQQAGLNSNSENMSFNLRDQHQAQQFGQGRKRFSRDSISDDKISEIAMNVLPDTSIITDNRVNYHA